MHAVQWRQVLFFRTYRSSQWSCHLNPRRGAVFYRRSGLGWLAQFPSGPEDLRTSAFVAPGLAMRDIVSCNEARLQSISESNGNALIDAHLSENRAMQSSPAPSSRRPAPSDTCRICTGKERGPLVQPCACRGVSSWVHPRYDSGMWIRPSWFRFWLSVLELGFI